MDDKKIARINELYHKSKAEGLFVIEKDGSITNLGEKFGDKKGNQKENIEDPKKL